VNAVNPANGPVLRDIHAPLPPSWWPPAPGWWLLAVAIAALLVIISIQLYRKAQVRRRRLALIAEFERAVADARDNASTLAATLSILLRRAQLRRAPHAATLSGLAWLDHLDRVTGSDEFTTGVGRVLVDAPYRPRTQFDAPALIALVRRSLLASFEAEVAAHV